MLKQIRVWVLVFALILSFSANGVVAAQGEEPTFRGKISARGDRAQPSIVPEVENRYIVDENGDYYYFLQLCVTTPGTYSNGINGYVEIYVDNNMLNPVLIDSFSLNRTQPSNNPNYFTYGFTYTASISSCYVKLSNLVIHTVGHGSISHSNITGMLYF